MERKMEYSAVAPENIDKSLANLIKQTNFSLSPNKSFSRHAS